MGILDLAEDVAGLVTQNAIPLGIGAVGGATAGALVTSAVMSGGSGTSARRRKRRITHTRRGWAQDRKRRSKQKWEIAYQRRKRKGKKRRSGRLHYTKKGQPYIILASGKARFVKKR